MNKNVTEKLDPRAKWDQLVQFKPHQVSKLIDIPEDDLKTLCLQECSVLMHKFNVLTRISDAYNEDCRSSDQEPSEAELETLFRERGWKIYKRFYEPRLEWFAQQREYMWHLRQQELYYKSIIELIKMKQKADETYESFPQSFPEINTENFMSTAMTLPHSTQNSEVSESQFLSIVAQLDDFDC